MNIIGKLLKRAVKMVKHVWSKAVLKKHNLVLSLKLNRFLVELTITCLNNVIPQRMYKKLELLLVTIIQFVWQIFASIIYYCH